MFLYLVLKKYFLLNREQRENILFLQVQQQYTGPYWEMQSIAIKVGAVYISIQWCAQYTLSSNCRISSKSHDPQWLQSRLDRDKKEHSLNRHIICIYIYQISIDSLLSRVPSVAAAAVCVYYSRFFQRLFDCFRPAYIRQVK